MYSLLLFYLAGACTSVLQAAKRPTAIVIEVASMAFAFTIFETLFLLVGLILSHLIVFPNQKFVILINHISYFYFI